MTNLAHNFWQFQISGMIRKNMTISMTLIVGGEGSGVQTKSRIFRWLTVDIGPKFTVIFAAQHNMAHGGLII